MKFRNSFVLAVEALPLSCGDPLGYFSWSMLAQAWRGEVSMSMVGVSQLARLHGNYSLVQWFLPLPSTVWREPLRVDWFRDFNHEIEIYLLNQNMFNF